MKIIKKWVRVNSVRTGGSLVCIPVAVVLCPGGNHKALITDGMTHTTTPAVPFRIPPTCDRLKLIRPSISRNTFIVEVFFSTGNF